MCETDFLTESDIQYLNDCDYKFKMAKKEVATVDKELAKYLWRRRDVCYSRFWELALAATKKNVFWCDEMGKDHSDGTEIKTTTTRNEGTSVCATVGNMKNKFGDLKIVVWHHVHKKHYYYFIPKKRVRSIVLASQQLRLSFPVKREPTGWQVPYQVASFAELAAC